MLNKLFRFLFKEYPAFLFQKPSIYRILVLPLLLVYKITLYFKKN